MTDLMWDFLFLLHRFPYREEGFGGSALVGFIPISTLSGDQLVRLIHEEDTRTRVHQVYPLIEWIFLLLQRPHLYTTHKHIAYITTHRTHTIYEHNGIHNTPHNKQHEQHEQQHTYDISHTTYTNSNRKKTTQYTNTTGRK